MSERVEGETIQQEKAAPRVWLWLEFAALFVVLPLALWIWWLPNVLFLLLFAVTALAAWWLARGARFKRRDFWRGDNARGEAKQLKRLLFRFLICAALLAGFVYFFYPQNLFGFPRERTRLWAAIMIFYPLLSVYPQELIYRAFFFERYKPILSNSILMIFLSAAAFGWLHIIFRNPLAIVLTIVGGVFFAETYARTRSLRLVWLEHSLYGCLIFTIGLGEFFYHGRVAP